MSGDVGSKSDSNGVGQGSGTTMVQQWYNNGNDSGGSDNSKDDGGNGNGIGNNDGRGDGTGNDHGVGI